MTTMRRRPAAKKKAAVNAFEAELQALQARHTEVIKTMNNGIATLDNGFYIVKVEQAVLGTNKKGLYAQWDVVVVSGPSAGEAVRFWDNIGSHDVAYKIFMERLAILGYDPSEIAATDYPKTLAEISSLNPQVRIKVDGDEYKNYYFDKEVSDVVVDDDTTIEETTIDETTANAEPQTDDDDDEDVAVDIGDSVGFTVDGKDHEGIIKKIDNETQTVKVKVAGKRKLVEVSIDDVWL